MKHSLINIVKDKFKENLSREQTFSEDKILVNHPVFSLLSLGLVVTLLAIFVSLGATYLRLNADTESMRRWLGNEERELTSILMNRVDDPVELNLQLTEAKAEFEALAFPEFHLVVDTKDDKLYLMYENKIIRDMDVSITRGKKIISKSETLSNFSFPVGLQMIEKKTTNYQWETPWWYFVDKGMPVKTGNPCHEAVSKYIIYFGNNYMIYSTPTTKIPYDAVKFGSLEVSEQEMKAIFDTIKPGSRIYIL